MVIGCVSFVPYDGKIVAIKCSKGRGSILPGGKVEPGEDFKQAAARELREETRLEAAVQTFLFGGFTDDDVYVYTFLTKIYDFTPRNSSEGEVVLATWSDLLDSKFRGYYQILQDVMPNRQ